MSRKGKKRPAAQSAAAAALRARLAARNHNANPNDEEMNARENQVRAGLNSWLGNPDAFPLRDQGENIIRDTAPRKPAAKAAASSPRGAGASAGAGAGASGAAPTGTGKPNAKPAADVRADWEARRKELPPEWADVDPTAIDFLQHLATQTRATTNETLSMPATGTSANDANPPPDDRASDAEDSEDYGGEESPPHEPLPMHPRLGKSIAAVRALMARRRWTRADFIAGMKPLQVEEAFPIDFIQEAIAVRDNSVEVLYDLFRDLINRCVRELRGKILESVDILYALNPLVNIANKITTLRFDTDVPAIVDVVLYLYERPSSDQLQGLAAAMRLLKVSFDEGLGIEGAIKMGLCIPLADLLNSVGEDVYPHCVSGAISLFTGAINYLSKPIPLPPSMDDLATGLLRTTGRAASYTPSEQYSLFLALHSYYARREWRPIPLAQLGYFGTLVELIRVAIEYHSRIAKNMVTVHVGLALNILLLFLDTAKQLGPSMAVLPGPDRPALESLLDFFEEEVIGFDWVVAYEHDRVSTAIGKPHQVWVTSAIMDPNLSEKFRERVRHFATEAPISHYDLRGGQTYQDISRRRTQWILDCIIDITTDSYQYLPVLITVMCDLVDVTAARGLEPPSFDRIWWRDDVWVQLEKALRGPMAQWRNNISRRWREKTPFLCFAYLSQFPEACAQIASRSLLNVLSLGLDEVQAFYERDAHDDNPDDGRSTSAKHQGFDEILTAVIDTCTSLALICPGVEVLPQSFQPVSRLINLARHSQSAYGLYTAALFLGRGTQDVKPRDIVEASRKAANRNDITMVEYAVLALWEYLWYMKQHGKPHAPEDWEPYTPTAAAFMCHTVDGSNAMRPLIQETARDAMDMIREFVPTIDEMVAAGDLAYSNRPQPL